MKNEFKLALVCLSIGLALTACSKTEQAAKVAIPAEPTAQKASTAPVAANSSVMVEVYYNAKSEKHASKVLNKLVRAGINAVEGGQLGKIFEKDRLKEPMNTFAIDRNCDPMIVEKVWAAANDGTLKKKSYDLAWFNAEQRKHVILIALIN